MTTKTILILGGVALIVYVVMRRGNAAGVASSINTDGTLGHEATHGTTPIVQTGAGGGSTPGNTYGGNDKSGDYTLTDTPSFFQGPVQYVTDPVKQWWYGTFGAQP